MTIIEKLTSRKENELRLYKEGVFWVAYEQDAYLVSQVKTLKPTKKAIKSIQREIVSVGFPSSSLDGVLSHFPLISRGENLVVMKVDAPVVPSDFENWKKQINLSVHPTRKEEPAPENQALINRIKAFKLHTASPMDCMRFIEEIQQEFC